MLRPFPYVLLAESLTVDKNITNSGYAISLVKLCVLNIGHTNILNGKVKY